MLDEILVIKESLPIFYYNRDPDIALSEDWYILQSGFFVALSQFASEMSDDKLKYIVLENKLYALDEVSDILLIFGDKEKMSQEVVNKLQDNLKKASNYLNYLIEKHNVDFLYASQLQMNDLAKDFGEYLKTEELVEDDTPFDPQASRSMMQKFIFKSIGYKPGQCNIGPAERMKRLLMGMSMLPFVIGGALTIMLLGANAFWMLTLILPLIMTFMGIYQYYFKFCAVNGLTKKYQMQ